MTTKKYYIEAGANDGVEQSRSTHLKNNKDYFGILIEPLPDVYEACIKNRMNDRTKVYNYALTSFDYDKNFIELYGPASADGLMATACLMPNKEDYPRRHTVPATTLDSIFKKNNINEVEYFFLDVEGYELEVLKGIDFNSVSFSNIEIECHYYLKQIPKEEEIQDFVKFLSNHCYNFKGVLDEPQPKMLFEKRRNC